MRVRLSLHSVLFAAIVIPMMVSMYCVAIPDILSADELFTVRGLVVDQNGVPLTGARIIIERTRENAVTDSTGMFMIKGLSRGSYNILIHADASFKDASRTIEIDGGEIPFITIVLEERLYTADEIVILSAGRKREALSEKTPASVSVITRDEFIDKAATVADIVTSTPSATVTSTGGLGSFTEVSLRGSYSNQVQVYLDGMLLNEAIGGAVNLGTLPLANVEKVEVWRSGAPARFGGDAVGGAINITTRDICTAKKTMTASYGSFNTVTAGAVLTVSGKTSRFLATIDAASSDNDFEYRSDNGTSSNPDDDYTAKRSNDEYRSGTILAKYIKMFGDGALLELSNLATRSDKNIPAPQHIYDSHASLATTKNLFQGRFTWKPEKASWLEMLPTLHHIVNHEHYVDSDNTIGWGQEDSTYDTNSYGINLPLTANVGSFLTMNLTPIVKRETFRPDNKLDNTVPLSCDRDQTAVIIDGVLTSPKKVATLTGTIRRDRYDSSYEGRLNVYSPEKTPPVRHYFTNTQMGVRLAVLPWLALQGNYGDNWREPSFYELFGDRGMTVSRPGLLPERVFKHDYGFRMTMLKSGDPINGVFETLRFENSYCNVIQWYTNNSGFIEPFNVGGAYVKGAEFIWRMNCLERLVFSGSVTHQDSKVTATAKSYHRNKQLPNRPRKYGNMTVELPVRFVSLFWHSDFKDSYYLDRANQVHRRYSGRTIHDIGATVPFLKESASCTVSAHNITDERTFDILGLPKPGRSLTVSLSYTFQ